MLKPILDSMGKPVRSNSQLLSKVFDQRNTPIMSGPPGKSLLSGFSGNKFDGLKKAGYSRFASNIEMANPSIRSPLLNQSNFYMPESDSSTGEPNRLLNQWISYYYKWNPIVGNVIDLHSELPLSRFALRGIDEPEILHFYEEMVESMELHLKMIELLKQYFLYGEVAPFAFWSDDYNCFTDLTFLDLNYIYVKGHYLLHSDDGDDVEFYELEPDMMLQQLVKSDDYVTRMLRGYLDAEFISAVRNNKRILLSNFSTHMIKHKTNYGDLRGTSIVLRCLKSLLYGDKLRESQYSIADSHINPKWIWKLGQAGDLAQGGYMPTEDDLDAFRELLIQANNDPVFTIITHYAVNVEAVGLNGKLLPTKEELKYITEEVLMALFANTAVTTGTGPNFACYDEETETLTENGFKKYNEIKNTEKIATFNPVTEQLEYHLPISRHVYDYDSKRDGKMVHFKTGKMDIKVTPNHRMYTKSRHGTTWGIERADAIKPRAYFRSELKWSGKYKPVPKKVKTLLGVDVTLADWCELVGYFVSEGWTVDVYRDHRVGIRQLETSKHYSRMKELCVKLGFSSPKGCFLKCGVDIAQYFRKTFGHGCLNKKLPKWMKNLPTPYLNILLNALVDGDGNRRPANIKKVTTKKYYRYCSTSKQLINDVFEIVYKLGYVPKLSQDKKVPENHNMRYYVMWSDGDAGRYPMVHSTNGNEITRVDYKGKVYCFEVPNHLFITMRNGFVTIQGNTASVAFRAMMSRYIPIRAKVERYLYQKIFAPVAYANKFYKRKQADLDHAVRTGQGANELLIPQIDWRSKANLLDDGSVKSIIASQVQAGKLPMRLLTEALDIDYDEARNYLFSEQGTVFDNVAIEARKRASAKVEDNSLMGQPMLPKTNAPMSVPVVEPVAKAASKAADRLLTIQPLATGDDIQTKINQGKPEKGGNPETPDPMAKALELDASKDKEVADLKPRIFAASGGMSKRKLSKRLVEKQFEKRAETHETVTVPPKEQTDQTDQTEQTEPIEVDVEITDEAV